MYMPQSFTELVGGVVIVVVCVILLIVAFLACEYQLKQYREEEELAYRKRLLAEIGVEMAREECWFSSPAYSDDARNMWKAINRCFLDGHTPSGYMVRDIYLPSEKSKSKDNHG